MGVYTSEKIRNVALIGHSGCGKTSLFNSILASKEAQNGKITIGETIRIGYFKQIDEIMDSNVKVIDYLKEYGEYIEGYLVILRTCVSEEIFQHPAAILFCCAYKQV